MQTIFLALPAIQSLNNSNNFYVSTGPNKLTLNPYCVFNLKVQYNGTFLYSETYVYDQLFQIFHRINVFLTCLKRPSQPKSRSF